MKLKKTFPYFLFTFSIMFLVGNFIQYIGYNADVLNPNQLFEEFVSALNLSLLFTLSFTISNLKRTISSESLKTERKKVALCFYFIFWVVAVLWVVTKPLFSGCEIKWVKTIFAGALLALFEMGLALLLSSFFQNASRKHKQSGL